MSCSTRIQDHCGRRTDTPGVAQRYTTTSNYETPDAAERQSLLRVQKPRSNRSACTDGQQYREVKVRRVVTQMSGEKEHAHREGGSRYGDPDDAQRLRQLIPFHSATASPAHA